MSGPCDDVGPFVDGELGTEAADAFRRHLATCAACQRDVQAAMQLEVLFAGAREDIDKIITDRRCQRWRREQTASPQHRRDSYNMNTDPTPEEITAEPLLQLFKHMHLPPHLRSISQPFGVLARKLVADLPRNPERSTSLRKLREAKDCAVTAFIWA